MNIERLFRYLDGLCVHETWLEKERQRIEHLSLMNATYGAQGSFSFQLGGSVGAIVHSLLQEASLDMREQSRIMALAVEGASRIGMAYLFHAQRSSFVALCEALIAHTLLEKNTLESVAQFVPSIFALAPPSLETSKSGYTKIVSIVRSAVQFVPSNREMPPTSLSIEPLYHQDRMLSETMVLGTHPVPLEQHTAIEGLEEILLRHIRAASKRLRHDQIDHIDIWLPYGTNEQRLREQMSALILLYPDPVPSFSSLSDAQKEQCHQIAQKIHFFAHQDSWKQHWTLAYKTLGALYSSATPKERGVWLHEHTGIGRWEHFWLNRTLTQVLCVEQFSFSFPVYLELYTTRGGCWKEKRDTPNGAAAKRHPKDSTKIA